MLILKKGVIKMKKIFSVRNLVSVGICFILMISSMYVILTYNTVVISTPAEKNIVERLASKYVPVYNEGTYICLMSTAEKKEHFEDRTFLTMDELSVGQVYYLSKGEKKLYKFGFNNILHRWCFDAEYKPEPKKKEV